MATSIIDIQKALNPDWLEENKCVLVLPKNKVFKVRILHIFWNNFHLKKKSDNIKRLITLVDDISKRTFERMMYQNFEINSVTVGKRLFEDSKKVERVKKQDFIIDVISKESNEVKYTFNVKSNKPVNIKIPSKKRHLSPKRIEKIKEEQVTVTTIATIRNEEERELVAKRICEYFATGMVDLNMAAGRYGVTSVDFLSWMQMNHTIQEMFLESTMFAKFNRTVTQGIALSSRADELLRQGYVETVNINYRRVFNQFHPEGIWVETTKNVSKRGLDERGIAMLDSILKAEVPKISMDEFDALPIDQQYEQVIELMEKRDLSKKKK